MPAGLLVGLVPDQVHIGELEDALGAGEQQAGDPLAKVRIEAAGHFQEAPLDCERRLVVGRKCRFGRGRHPSVLAHHAASSKSER